MARKSDGDISVSAEQAWIELVDIHPDDCAPKQDLGTGTPYTNRF
jgi:hypothetical protein